MSDKDWMLVEFKGTYLCAHPDGIKGQKVTRPFHVKVEMKKQFLRDLKPFESLCGPFAVYYVGLVKNLYPELIDLHRFEMIEATELDGTKINDPRAMCHEDLLEHISDRELPINAGMLDAKDLRHHIMLHAQDPKGQARMQENLQKVRGGHLAISKEIGERKQAIRAIESEAGKIQKVQEPAKEIKSKAPAATASEQKKSAGKSPEKPAENKPADNQDSEAMLDEMLSSDSAYASA